jgi:hypothetical protein
MGEKAKTFHDNWREKNGIIDVKHVPSSRVSPLSSIRGAAPPSRNNFPHANRGAKT